MTRAPKFFIVLVTTPSLRVARSLAQAALKSRLIACANILPGVESHYWWEGKITSGKEFLLLLKTGQNRLKRLERLILEKHPYNTPEFIALPVSRGSQSYLNWLADELA